MNQTLKDEEKIITQAVVRLNAGLTGLVTGFLLGLSLFIATNWLVLKGGPDPGPHLGLLSQYFPGYSVTFFGSLIGFVYAFSIGFLGGALIGAVYNRLAR